MQDIPASLKQQLSFAYHQQDNEKDHPIYFCLKWLDKCATVLSYQFNSVANNTISIYVKHSVANNTISIQANIIFGKYQIQFCLKWLDKHTTRLSYLPRWTTVWARLRRGWMANIHHRFYNNQHLQLIHCCRGQQCHRDGWGSLVDKGHDNNVLQEQLKHKTLNLVLWVHTIIAYAFVGWMICQMICAYTGNHCGSLCTSWVFSSSSLPGITRNIYNNILIPSM